MLKIDKDETDEDSDNPTSKSNTATPKKTDAPIGGNIAGTPTESPIHVNNINNSIAQNVSIPMLPKVSSI